MPPRGGRTRTPRNTATASAKNPARKTASARTAVTAIGTALAVVLVGLTITASAGRAQELGKVPERNILFVDAGPGVQFEADLPLDQSKHLVRVNGAFVHIDLDSFEVEEDGWQLSQMPLDPESRIQAYDLKLVK